MSSEKLCELCSFHRWEEARTMMDESPRVIWGGDPRKFIYWIVRYDRVELLEHMKKTIKRALLEEWYGAVKNLLFFTACGAHGPAIIVACKFDSVNCLRFLTKELSTSELTKDVDGRSPAGIASMFRSINCLKFIVEQVGVAELERITGCEEENCAHCAVSQYHDNIECLEFILRHAPSSIAILHCKNKSGKTPLRDRSHEWIKRLTPEKIRKIGLENELSLISKFQATGCFVALVFDLICQETQQKIQRTS